MSQDFKGGYMIITGGAGAIGRALCIEAVKRGAFVYCVDRDPTALDNIQKEIGPEHLKSIQCELSDWKGTRSILEAAVPRNVAVRYLVNLAGVFRGDAFDKITEENFDYVFDINVKASIHVSQFFVERLKEHSGPPEAPDSPISVEVCKGERYRAEGSIVHVSSFVSSIASPAGDSTVYCISKAAIDELTKSMAVELAPRRIRVNAVRPGCVGTLLCINSFPSKEQLERSIGRFPQRRFIDPVEVADTILYLLSDRASAVTGELVLCDGGRLAAC